MHNNRAHNGIQTSRGEDTPGAMRTVCRQAVPFLSAKHASIKHAPAQSCAIPSPWHESAQDRGVMRWMLHIHHCRSAALSAAHNTFWTAPHKRALSRPQNASPERDTAAYNTQTHATHATGNRPTADHRIIPPHRQVRHCIKPPCHKVFPPTAPRCVLHFCRAHTPIWTPRERCAPKQCRLLASHSASDTGQVSSTLQSTETKDSSNPRVGSTAAARVPVAPHSPSGMQHTMNATYKLRYQVHTRPDAQHLLLATNWSHAHTRRCVHCCHRKPTLLQAHRGIACSHGCAGYHPWPRERSHTTVTTSPEWGKGTRATRRARSEVSQREGLLLGCVECNRSDQIPCNNHLSFRPPLQAGLAISCQCHDRSCSSMRGTVQTQGAAHSMPPRQLQLQTHVRS